MNPLKFLKTILYVDMTDEMAENWQLFLLVKELNNQK
jgi:hypothetical protein